jgi:hypothetical protein
MLKALPDRAYDDPRNTTIYFRGKTDMTLILSKWVAQSSNNPLLRQAVDGALS